MYALVPAPNSIFTTCPCALRPKTTLEKVHYAKNTLMHSLLYIRLTQQIWFYLIA